MALSATELKGFEQQLRAREQQLLSELESGKNRVTGSESFEQVASEVPDAGDASVADTVADGINAERERDRDELRDVQSALTRIENGSFGLCQRCGEEIDLPRLKAMPTARYDLRHQEEVDRERGAVTATPKL